MRISDYLAWQESEEGKKACALRINEGHKEMLFHKWDTQIRKAEQAAEEEAITTSLTVSMKTYTEQTSFQRPHQDFSQRHNNCRQVGNKRLRKG